MASDEKKKPAIAAKRDGAVGPDNKMAAGILATLKQLALIRQLGNSGSFAVCIGLYREQISKLNINRPIAG